MGGGGGVESCDKALHGGGGMKSLKNLYRINCILKMFILHCSLSCRDCLKMNIGSRKH